MLPDTGVAAWRQPSFFLTQSQDNYTILAELPGRSMTAYGMGNKLNGLLPNTVSGYLRTALYYNLACGNVQSFIVKHIAVPATP